MAGPTLECKSCWDQAATKEQALMACDADMSTQVCMQEDPVCTVFYGPFMGEVQAMRSCLDRKTFDSQTESCDSTDVDCAVGKCEESFSTATLPGTHNLVLLHCKLMHLWPVKQSFVFYARETRARKLRR